MAVDAVAGLCHDAEGFWNHQWRSWHCRDGQSEWWPWRCRACQVELGYLSCQQGQRECAVGDSDVEGGIQLSAPTKVTYSGTFTQLKVASLRLEAPVTRQWILFHVLHVESYVGSIIIATCRTIIWSSSMRALRLWPAGSKRQSFLAIHSWSSLLKSLLLWNLKSFSSCRVHDLTSCWCWGENFCWGLHLVVVVDGQRWRLRWLSHWSWWSIWWSHKSRGRRKSIMLSHKSRGRRWFFWQSHKSRGRMMTIIGRLTIIMRVVISNWWFIVIITFSSIVKFGKSTTFGLRHIVIGLVVGNHLFIFIAIVHVLTIQAVQVQEPCHATRLDLS